jgi:outer membrane autotransporter protein
MHFIWRLSNATTIFTAMLLGCIWAWRPCLGQVETNAYISNRDSSNVSVIDTATNTVIGSPISVGSRPIGVAVTPDGRFSYVANELSNTISVIDVATNTVIGSPITVGNSPFGIAATPDAKFAYITNFGSNTVSVINTSTNTVIVPSIVVGSAPVGVCVTPGGTFAYVTNATSNTVSVISTATNTVVGSPIPVGTQPEGIAVSPDGKFVYVANVGSNTVSVINTATNTVVGSPILVGTSPVGVAVSRDGKFVYVANELSNTVSVIDTATNTVVGSPIPVGGGPFGIAITPDGKFAYVGNAGSNTVSVINTATNTVVGSPIPVGTSPFVFGSFIGPNIIVAQGGPLLVANDAALTGIGFGNFVDFNGGTLKTTGSLLSSRTISLLAQGGIIDTNGFNSTLSGPIVGTGGLSKIGSGTLTLTGSNSYSGGTTINAGILAVFADNNLGAPNGGLSFNGGTLENIASFTTARAMTLNSSGTISTDPGTTLTQTGVISGVGSLTKVGAGTLTLLGTNSYSGGTAINAGILAVFADNNLGAPNGGLSFNGGTLENTASFTTARAMTLNSSGTISTDPGTTLTQTGVISGIGSLTKVGSGTLTLVGTNTYSGGTVLNAGTLTVNGPQALGLGNVVVNGGTLNADPQPISIKGNYTQNAGGTLELNIGGASPAQHDYLNVTGNASLNGTLRLLNSGYTPNVGDVVRLVQTGGLVAGRFATFANPFTTRPGLNTIDLKYGRNFVDLVFLNVIVPPSPPVIIDFASFAQTPNQLAAAGLLDAVQLDPGAADLMSFLIKEPFANLPSDFNKISPESLTAFYEISFSGANIQRLNLENRLEDIRNGSGGESVAGATVYLEDKADGKSSKNPPMLPPVREKRWDFWSTSFGDFVHVDSDFNARGYKFTTGGIDLGIDYRLTDHLGFGLMGSYAHTWSDLRPGSIDVDSARGGIYATYFNRCFYINGGIYGGYNSYDSSRRGLQGNANGNSDGAEFSTFVSGGYDFRFGHLTIGPIASLQYTNVYVDGFREKGSLAPLSIHSDSEESLRSDVGFRASYQWRIGSVDVEPFLKATWEHEFKYSTLPITAGFADISGPSATFLGPAEGHDSAVLDAGISVSWTPCISTFVSYNGLLGRARYDSNGVSGGIRIRF